MWVKDCVTVRASSRRTLLKFSLPIHIIPRMFSTVLFLVNCIVLPPTLLLMLTFFLLNISFRAIGVNRATPVLLFARVLDLFSNTPDRDRTTGIRDSSRAILVIFVNMVFMLPLSAKARILTPLYIIFLALILTLFI